MFKKALKLDGKQFGKHKRIRAKRPSEYWLVFLKKYVLKKHREGFSWTMLTFLIPFIIVGLAGYTVIQIQPESPIWLFVIFFGFILMFIVFGARFSHMQKRDFVDPNAFDHLAKFIIYIKGDTFKNLIGLDLNIAGIEDKDHAMDLTLLGLKEKYGLRYAAYQMERYRATIRLKDDSFCSASLYQMVLKTTTTKRRSSGKIKTKSKRKHKFYYILSLKLSAAAYEVMNTQSLVGFSDRFEITAREENGFHIVKIKCKEKLFSVEKKITAKQKRRPSIYYDMLDFVFHKKIIVPIARK